MEWRSSPSCSCRSQCEILMTDGHYRICPLEMQCEGSNPPGAREPLCKVNRVQFPHNIKLTPSPPFMPHVINIIKYCGNRNGSGCTFATSRICSTFQRWREGSAPFNWPSEPKKESNFSARFDSIWLCTGLEQNHITWIWSGGRQPTFRGQHHLCLISFGVGFIFTFTGPSVKRFDHLDPLQWLRSCRQIRGPNGLPTQCNFEWPGSKTCFLSSST